jgi:hypothetical protein
MGEKLDKTVKRRLLWTFGIYGVFAVLLALDWPPTLSTDVHVTEVTESELGWIFAPVGVALALGVWLIARWRMKPPKN